MEGDIMARYKMQQTKGKSCGAVGLAIALAELGAKDLNWAQTNAETTVYAKVQRGPNEVSAPAKIAKYANEMNRSVYVMESYPRTLILRTTQKAIMEPEWKLYTKELSDENLGKWPIGLGSGDLDKGAMALIACVITDTADAGGMHYLLARKDGKDYYVMDPAYDTDTNFPGLTDFLWFTSGDVQIANSQRKYAYLGVSIWIK